VQSSSRKELKEGDILLAPRSFNVPEISEIDLVGALR